MSRLAYNREIALVVTGNGDFESLNQLDERIASRLVEMCDRIKFHEADYRAQIAKNRSKGVTWITPRGGVDEKQAHTGTGTAGAQVAEG
jgi:hypothetical protein